MKYKLFLFVFILSLFNKQANTAEHDPKASAERTKGITLINLPKEPLISNSSSLLNNNDVSYAVKEVIREEITGKLMMGDTPYLITEFTLAEAEKYLKPGIEAASVKNPALAKNLPMIISPKHFVIPKSTEHIDILTLSEDEQYTLFSSDNSLTNAINTCFLNKNLEALEASRDTIDPRLLLLSGEMIFKFYERYSGSSLNRPDLSEIKEKLLNYFAFPIENPMRTAFYLTHDLGILTHPRIQGIYERAKRIIECTEEGSSIVVFGNTPYYIARGIKRILDKKPHVKRTIIELPMSGSPNTRIRLSNPLRDIVTSDRLQYFKGRLQKLGLLDGNELLKHKTYIMDGIGTGSSISYTLTTMLQEFATQQLPKLPYIEVIALNELRMEDSKNQTIVERDGLDGETVELAFPSKSNVYFTISCQVVHWPDLEAFDLAPQEQPLSRVFPQYNACRWSEEYDYLITQDYPPHIKIMLEHFDTNINHLMISEDPTMVTDTVDTKVS